MPEPLVEARFTASPTAVLAALTAQLQAQGDHVTGVSGFGAEVTWRAFDGALELVELCAEIGPDPAHPGVTLLVVRRCDPALEAALDTAARPPRADDGADDRGDDVVGPGRLTG